MLRRLERKISLINQIVLSQHSCLHTVRIIQGELLSAQTEGRLLNRGADLKGNTCFELRCRKLLRLIPLRLTGFLVNRIIEGNACSVLRSRDIAVKYISVKLLCLRHKDRARQFGQIQSRNARPLIVPVFLNLLTVLVPDQRHRVFRIKIRSAIELVCFA